MDHTPFIVLSYTLAIGGVVLMLGLSWRRMRRAERAMEKLQNRERPQEAG